MSRSPEELSSKIQSAIERQQKEENLTKTDSKSSVQEASSARTALRAATDLVAALFVGGAFGYWLDDRFGTRPWLMVIFILLGFAAGFLNIYRAQTGRDYRTGFKETSDKKE